MHLREEPLVFSCAGTLWLAARLGYGVWTPYPRLYVRQASAMMHAKREIAARYGRSAKHCRGIKED